MSRKNGLTDVEDVKSVTAGRKYTVISIKKEFALQVIGEMPIVFWDHSTETYIFFF